MLVKITDEAGQAMMKDLVEDTTDPGSFAMKERQANAEVSDQLDMIFEGSRRPGMIVEWITFSHSSLFSFHRGSQKTRGSSARPRGLFGEVGWGLQALARLPFFSQEDEEVLCGADVRSRRKVEGS